MTERPEIDANKLSVYENRPRKRDIVITAVIGACSVLMLLIAGAIEPAPSFLALGMIAVLSLIYYLVFSRSQPRPEPVPGQEDTPSVEDLEPQFKTSELMISKISVPVLLIGDGGRIEKANPAARAFLGINGEGGMLSASLRQPSVLEAVSSALKGEQGGVVEYSTLAPLESHVRAFIEPIKLDDSGAMPWRAMLVLADDTSVKRVERMRADFLANASHELRTPLASLSGFIETLKGPAKDDPEAQEKFLNIMDDQTERMRRLIDDLLSLSRIEMNEHVTPEEDVDLTELVDEVTSSLLPVAQQRNIDLNVDMPEGSALIRGDRDQLYEVIENLVGNALKYSNADGRVCVCVYQSLTRDMSEHVKERISEDSGRLTITAPSISHEARYAVIRVLDRGQGIDRRYLPRISERFFRVDGQKSSPTSGTGLGLAIVKHIVARHRGGFTVESALNKGSVFSIFFPVQRERDTSEAVGNEPISEDSLAP